MRLIKPVFACSISALVLALFMGCTPPNSTQTNQTSDDVSAASTDVVHLPNLTDPRVIEEAYSAHLLKKAKELAERELGRMAAAELTYRNKATFNQIPSGSLFAEGQGTYIKLYRNFTGYEIEDIYRSESFLYPVAYQVRFNFDMLATPPRSSTLQDAQKVAQTDVEFSVIGTFSLVRRYRADRNGEYVGNLPDLPPRPNYHTRAEGTEEAGAALPNNLPPGGALPGGVSPVQSILDSLPPASGGQF